MNAYFEAPLKGLNTELEGKKLYEWGDIFFNLSYKGLVNRKKMNANGKDETIYLQHIRDIIKNRSNRAQLLINKYEDCGNIDFLDNEKEDFSYTRL